MLKKKKHRPKMVSLLLKKPLIPNLDLLPDLIAVSSFPRHRIFIYQSGISWLYTSKVVCQIGPLHHPPHKKAIYMIKTLPFTLAGMAQLVEHHPMHQEVTHSVAELDRHE